jgi:hypothetical protein
MSKSFILVLPDKDATAEVQVVALKRKSSRTPTVVWNSRKAAEEAVSLLSEQHPQHLLLVVDAFTMQAEWEHKEIRRTL